MRNADCGMGNGEWMRGAAARKLVACFEEGRYHSGLEVTPISCG